ncbi:hypothetical protein M3Y97_01012400 [Aphelenchoides bicaudatus]|nr:hypothetical protein M3Y97_01012400 [Aphelenchoides bicaudatus]
MHINCISITSLPPNGSQHSVSFLQPRSCQDPPSILGFIICSLLCVNWYSGRSCLSDGRLAYASTLSFIVVVANVIIFLMNFLGLGLPKIVSGRNL